MAKPTTGTTNNVFVMTTILYSRPVAVQRCDAFGGPKRQCHERQGSIRTARIRQRRRPNHKQVLVIVRLSIAVAYAGRRVDAHAAAAGGVVQIVARRGI